MTNGAKFSDYEKNTFLKNGLEIQNLGVNSDIVNVKFLCENDVYVLFSILG